MEFLIYIGYCCFIFFQTFIESLLCIRLNNICFTGISFSLSQYCVRNGGPRLLYILMFIEKTEI